MLQLFVYPPENRVAFRLWWEAFYFRFYPQVLNKFNAFQGDNFLVMPDAVPFIGSKLFRYLHTHERCSSLSEVNFRTGTCEFIRTPPSHYKFRVCPCLPNQF